MKTVLFTLCLFFFVQSVSGQNDSILKKPKRHFELSFGQSLLFISSSRVVNIREQSAILVPTSAILFLAQFRTDKIMRVPVFLNIATESKQFLVDGKLINERASPTLGTGLVFKFLSFQIDKKSKVEFESGLLLSALYDQNNSFRLAPIAALRMRILRGENFVMYCGGSYSFGVNAIGMLYGTGTIF